MRGPRSKPVQCLSGDRVRHALAEGVRLQAAAVGRGFGPKGGMTLLDRPSGIMPTRDGETIAREWLPDDPWQAIGAKALSSTVIGLAERVGDGTKTCAIITAAMVSRASKLIAAGHDPTGLARDASDVLTKTLNLLSVMAQPVTNQADLQRALEFAIDDGDVAATVARAVMAVGTDGFVSVRDGHRSDGLELVFSDGLVLGTAVGGLPFQAPEGASWTLDGPMVAICRDHLWRFDQVRDLLEEATAHRPRPLLLICPGIEGEALATIALNGRQGLLSCVPWTPAGPGHSRDDILDDLAALTGATPHSRRSGLDFTPDMLGALRQADIGQGKATLVSYPDREPALRARAGALRDLAATCGSGHDRDRLGARAAALADGLCIVQVGGVSAPERAIRRALVGRALRVADGLLKHGVVAGGGRALAACVANLDLDVPGVSLIKIGLETPARRLGAIDGLPVDSAHMLRETVQAAWSLCAVIMRTGAAVRKINA